MEYNKEITRSDLNQLEEYLDRLYSNLGIDVAFTKHFIDRVNDARNNKQISINELRRLFKQSRKYHGKAIAQMGPDAEAVLKDMTSDVNIPFVLVWDAKNEELDLVAKTVMRKKNFLTRTPEFTVEANRRKQTKEFLWGLENTFLNADTSNEQNIKRMQEQYDYYMPEGGYMVEEFDDDKLNKFIERMTKKNISNPSIIVRLELVLEPTYKSIVLRIENYYNNKQIIGSNWANVMFADTKELKRFVMYMNTTFGGKYHIHTHDTNNLLNEGYEFIHEVTSNSVSKNDWKGQHPGHSYALDDSKKVGMVDEYEVWVEREPRGDKSVYLVYRHPKSSRYDRIVADFMISSWNSKNYWETASTQVDRAHQGKGLGLKLYIFMMKELKMTLVSGDSHSPGGMKTWQKIVNNPNVTSWVQAAGDRNKFPVEFDPDTGELESFIEPYGDDEYGYSGVDDEDINLGDLDDQYDAGEISNKEHTQKYKEIKAQFKREKDANRVSSGARIFASWGKPITKEGYEFIHEAGRITPFVQTDDVNEINVGPDQSPASITDKERVLSLPVYDQFKDFDVRVSDDKKWIAFTQNQNVISVIIISEHKSGHHQLTKTWTNEKYRGNNISGDLIVYAVKELKITPLLSDDTMSPDAIGRFQKILNSNKLEVSIWDQDMDTKTPYSKESPIYTDIFKKLKSNITNTGASQDEGDRYVWVMEKWNKWDNKKNYLGEGLLSKQTEYFLPKYSGYEYVHEAGRITPFVQTDDVNANEIIPHAMKFNNKVNTDGYPPLMNGEMQQIKRSKIEYTEAEHDDYVQAPSFKKYLGEANNINLSNSYKLWINPDKQAIVDVIGSHHTKHAYDHPEKYSGLGGNIFDDYEYPEDRYQDGPSLYDDFVGKVMYDNGWVRYATSPNPLKDGINANIQSSDQPQIAKAIKYMMQNNIQFKNIMIDVGYTTNNNEFIKLDNPQDIKNFARTGKKPVSRMNQFRESAERKILLREYKEDGIDFDAYGSWINPDQHETLPVDTFEHVAVITTYDDEIKNYTDAFKKGWVRLVHDTDGVELTVEGPLATIRKAFKTYLRGVEKVFLNIEIDMIGGNYFYFDTDDRNDMKKMRGILQKGITEAIQLNELRTRIQYDDHTVWISPEGQVWSLKDQSFNSATDPEQAIVDYDLNSFEQPAVTHGTWMAYNWEKIFGVPFNEKTDDPYDEPIEQGWLRIRNHGRQFNIQCKHESARKLFKIWYPAVVEKLKDEDEPIVFIDEISEDKMDRNSLVFKMPQDKIKLMNWGRGEVQESIQEAIDPRFKLQKFMKNPTKDISKQDVKKYMDRTKQGYGFVRDQMGPKTLTVQEIAAKHGVHEDQIAKELQKGIQAELEHTEDLNVSNEIARDHLAEIPDYYSRLDKMEKDITEAVETVERHDGKEIKVLVNPNSTALKGLFNASKYRELRGLYGDGNFYFWDGGELIHNAMANLLGLEYQHNFRLELNQRSDGLFALDHDETLHDTLEQSHWIDSLFNMEDHGWQDFVLSESTELTETFDNPYKYKWVNQDSSMWSGNFNIKDGGAVDVEIESNSENSWLIMFSQEGIYGKTDSGDEFGILGTVLAMIKEFITIVKPSDVYFVAEKDASLDSKNRASRIRLYSRMVTKFSGELGYTAEIKDQGYKTTYYLTRNINEGLNEVKMVQVPGFDNHAYVNPSASDLKALLNKFSSMRGSYREGKIHIWNAYDLTHDDMQDLIPAMDAEDFDFFLSNTAKHDDEFKEWDRTFEIAPGVWAEFYGEDSYQAVKVPMFKRMLPKSINEGVETVERHDGKEVKVLVNPNLTALTRMFKASSYGELRGLHDDNQFYFWDGGDLIHNAMADLLGLPYSDQSRLDLYTTRDRITILNHDEAAYDTLEQSRWVDSLFNAREVSGWPEFVLKEQIKEDLDDNIDLKNIIKQIDPKLQEIIAMRYDHDMTYAEIAKEIGKSQDWARQLVLKAQRRIKAVMIAHKNIPEEDKSTLTLPKLSKGDIIKVGKFKNRKAEIKGFKVDKNNHPVLKTTKGDQQVFKPRITKLMPENLDESFDQPYEYEWSEKIPTAWKGNFTLADGNRVVMSMQKNTHRGLGWSVDFARDGSFGTTGEGDEMRIFATVLKMIKEFVNEIKPDRMIFDAEKRKSGPPSKATRANLYRRMISRYALSLGYSVQEDDEGWRTQFILVRNDQVTEGYHFLSEDNAPTIQDIKSQCKNMMQFYKQYQMPLYHGRGLGSNGVSFNEFKHDRSDKANNDEGLTIPSDLDAVWDKIVGVETEVNRKDSLFTTNNKGIAQGYGGASLVFPQDGWSWMTVDSHVDLWDLVARGEFAEIAYKHLPEPSRHQNWPSSWSRYDAKTQKAIQQDFAKWLTKNKNKLGITAGTDKDLAGLAKAIREEGNEILITGPTNIGFYMMSDSNILTPSEQLKNQMYKEYEYNENWKTQPKHEQTKLMIALFPERIAKSEQRVKDVMQDFLNSTVSKPKDALEEFRNTVQEAGKAGKWLLMKGVKESRKTFFVVLKPNKTQPEVEVHMGRAGFQQKPNVDYKLAYTHTGHIKGLTKKFPPGDQIQQIKEWDETIKIIWTGHKGIASYRYNFIQVIDPPSETKSMAENLDESYNFLSEDKSAPLYHWTPIESLIKIFNSNLLKAKSELRYGKEATPKAISFTRDIERQFIPMKKGGKYPPVAIRVDQGKMVQNTGSKQAPATHDWDDASIAPNFKQGSSWYRYESEERFMGDIENISSYITGIVFAGKNRSRKTEQEFAEYITDNHHYPLYGVKIIKKAIELGVSVIWHGNELDPKKIEMIATPMADAKFKENQKRQRAR